MGYELNYKKNSILQSDKQHISTIYTYCYLLIFCTNTMILMHFLKLVSFSYLYAHYVSIEILVAITRNTENTNNHGNENLSFRGEKISPINSLPC